MKILGRFIVSLYALVIAMLSVMMVITLILFEFDKVSFGIVIDQIRNALTYGPAFPFLLGALLVFFVISIKLIVSGTNRKFEREPIIIEAAGGQIAISLETFENIAASALKKIPEVKEYIATVRKINQNVEVSVKMSVAPEVNIPQVSENVQTKTIEAIENSTGVKVLNVGIKVENLSTGFKAKIE